ncbi:glycosyltransferase family 4 protein [Georgenia yuyongxinii]|uniref:D-inositol 3-phosphate glycosyltransferase n=1 Tax=Georgenia yuyongxinii TaxID=2589797 RepID=A0A552WT51_9MICO|nr:glycosyltransferase family 4 protein [Georgenia yuyongxinii]TRW45865.1 glycosyltransferase family 4 protein [Georgenia yuyongxinii]
MRVVLATRIFTPEPAAASFRLQALAEALARAGHHVRVLTTRVPRNRASTGDRASTGENRASTGDRAGTGARSRTARGVAVSRWPVLRDRQGYVRGYLQYLSFDGPLAVRLAVTRADVVVVEPPPTTGAVVRVMCTLRRRPYVYYAADVWSDAAAQTGAPKIVVALLRRLEAWVLRGAARVIAVSDGVADRVRQLGATHVEVVPNGIDTTIFRPDGDGEASGRYLIYAGTASEWQGADIFARAMPKVLARVPDARLVYIGQGSAWGHIAALAGQLPPGAVELRDAVPPGEAARWQRGAVAAVVSIVPGQGYDFAYPTKILAALASGTPVIYAGVGPAAADVRDHRLGWVTDYDVDAVAEAMTEALERADDGATSARLAAWVEQYRSQRSSGERAAAVVAAARSRTTT